MTLLERRCSLAWTCASLVACDRAGEAAHPHVITPVDAEVHVVAPSPPPMEPPPIEDPTFAIAATLDGTALDEATAYVTVTIGADGRSEIVGVDVLGSRTAGCDDRSKWVTKNGAVLLTRAGNAWSAQMYAPDPEELPCPGGVDRAFGLGGGYARVRVDANEHALVPGTLVEGTLELETGKGASPAAKVLGRFVARVCPGMRP